MSQLNQVDLAGQTEEFIQGEMVVFTLEPK